MAPKGGSVKKKRTTKAQKDSDVTEKDTVAKFFVPIYVNLVIYYRRKNQMLLRKKLNKKRYIDIRDSYLNVSHI